ncbi:hypothetical protein JKP88DRAFT_92811 [Tribonema minus]|uniref:MRPL25 domain-containing protein n=1 Tax=Tribonema minus TaxID=303371 RepID=A0A836C926_9STRA|nr:hypothetical protein JKP88DRAFT_92811 [Tribonema minus]|eukprot:TRINITY_DN4149_c0_g1_i1.p1 TRINITY_DN4149_c0_g1~~TRINITY_DN4149_c0_g1_i1.p1  ORF type:complete len:136 (-),score=17.60 TRINITY_DN4149_c0_g1_i1:40-447(-)
MPRGVGVVRKLAEHGVAAMQPRIINGRWCQPLISRRQAAVQRKKAIVEGTYGSFSAETGGWNPSWDPAPAPIVARPHKGHLHQRNRATRAAKIDEALLKQDKLYLEAKKSLLHRRPEPGFEALLKRLSSRQGPRK